MRRMLFLVEAMVLIHAALGAQTVPGRTLPEAYRAKTPVTADDLRIAQHAAEILGAPEKWNHIDTESCPAGAKAFSLYCALEKASQEVTGQEDDRSAVMQEARIATDLMAPKKYGARLVDYNNDPGTTFQDIQEFSRILRNRLTRRMAEEAQGPILSLAERVFHSPDQQ